MRVTISESGKLAAIKQTAVARGDNLSNPALAAASPTSECVRLSNFESQIPLDHTNPPNFNISSECWSFRWQLGVSLRIELLQFAGCIGGCSGWWQWHLVGTLDRKSTRLNSSHLG